MHGVVWLDHQNAQLLTFDDDTMQAQRVQAHTHHTRQHGSGVRTEHEFFGEVCDALNHVPHGLVTGPKQGLADFKHYVNKHRPALLVHLVGWEVSDHTTENQLLAQARAFFLKYDHRAAPPPGEANTATPPHPLLPGTQA
jgi:stalled ribosome rescue protein Dom34